MPFHALTACQFIEKILSCMRCTCHITWLFVAECKSSAVNKIWWQVAFWKIHWREMYLLCVYRHWTADETNLDMSVMQIICPLLFKISTDPTSNIAKLSEILERSTLQTYFRGIQETLFMVLCAFSQLCIWDHISYIVFSQGFRNHQLHDPLVDPGSADLTADVDFSYFRACLENKLLTFGPVTQRDFLKRMGVDVRLQVGGAYTGNAWNYMVIGSLDKL